MFLSSSYESHPVHHVLEEICLLHREVFVHDLEELSVSENVRGAHLYCHTIQLVNSSMAGVVVNVGTLGYTGPGDKNYKIVEKIGKLV